MGIITNTKQYLAKKVTEKVAKIGDGIASAAVLSPAQLQEIESKRIAYMNQKPDMDSDEIQESIKRKLGAYSIEVYQAYLQQLKNVYKPMDAVVEKFDELNRIRYFDITKWVTDKTEKNLDKLVNVYQVLSEEDCNIALIYHRMRSGCRITMAVINTDMEQPDTAKVNSFNARIAAAIKGNFPGVEITESKEGIPPCLQSAIVYDNKKSYAKSVAAVSNLASDKSENFISQSMEKLLDGIVPASEDEEYTVVLLARPITDQLNARNRLFKMYSDLAPYSTWQTNYTYTESDGTDSSANAGLNIGAGVGGGMSSGTNRTELYGEYKKADAENQIKNLFLNKIPSEYVDEVIEILKKIPLVSIGILKKIPHEYIDGVIGQGKKFLGVYSPTTENNSFFINGSANFGVNFARASSVSVQIGKNEGLVQNFTNYGVKHTLEIIEQQIKRMDQSSALGMWEFASYVIAKSPVVTNNVAHMYLALTQGEDSFVTNAAINLWDGEEEKAEAETILKSIQKLQHPVFGRRDSLDDTFFLYPTLVTPSAVLTGKELAKALNFPRKSVSGLPVLESVSFGREVQKFSCAENEENKNQICIGNVYHMRQDDATLIKLDANYLTSHIFITGSTGTGKSNTIYQLLDKLHNLDNPVHFLVIEPAKGEYKKVFGGLCQVYGTNSSESEMLHINPFSFPDGIHVLEHIDRLIEIFNACWPMYAAMPAVLKDAVERCYEQTGWDLRLSRCYPQKFPTFNDLIKTLPEVMESSLYSDDTKSDYSGALITRVHSLTNGINGQIFCSERELTNEEIFDKDVIIDLSRIGSTETKSLMMGILVMKLQEYRMASGNMNADLTHVTVLEEAHNLLRKTSTVQSQENSNLQGKSVEMLTNSIAEMRTYGEGFIIADQAPGLLDEAVIRNTNTKIVLRLPDQSDRELVGTSMALTKEQIVELAKLPKGVAAVYQNDWVEAVLCHFEKFTKGVPLDYTPKDSTQTFEQFFSSYVFGITEKKELSSEDVDTIREWIDGLRDCPQTQDQLRNALKGVMLTEDAKEYIAFNIFSGKKIAQILYDNADDTSSIEKANNIIESFTGFTSLKLINEIRVKIMDLVGYWDRNELQQRYIIHSIDEERRKIL